MASSHTVVALLLACLLAACLGHPRLLFEKELRLERPEPEEDKTWLFAADGLKRPYAFINEVGALVGFDVDVIQEGLMDSWFDACPGYTITVDRQSAFDFTDPYLNTVSTFTVAPGNPFGFDPSKRNFPDLTLTHLTGAPTGAPCLKRLGMSFGTIIIAKDLPEAKALLLNKTVLFSPRTIIEGLDVLPTKYHCDVGGAGVMVKKGSPLPAWWNPAFRRFLVSGRYQELCEHDSARFSYPIKCLSVPTPPPSVDNN
ncbi:hypothetical protein ACOMHN_050971 [Nucella lapillus]